MVVQVTVFLLLLFTKAGECRLSDSSQCRDGDMLIEELHTSPRGEEGEAGEPYENGGGVEEGAGGHDLSLQGDAGGEGGEDGDDAASMEPPTSIIVTNLTLETFEEQVERVSYWTSIRERGRHELGRYLFYLICTF